jgi:autotransporter-associated beta strand protein
VLTTADATLTLNGTVTLLGDTLAGSYYQTNPGTLTFNKTIDGTGELYLRVERGCTANLNATNTYAGATVIEATHATEPGTVAVGAAGTFGDGPVTANNLSTILFKTVPGASMTNAIESAGTVKFNWATTQVTSSKVPNANGMDFEGPVSAAALEVNRATMIGVGTSLTVGALTGSFGESMVRATRAGAVLTLGRYGADNEVAARLDDGDGSLSLVKVGTNTVTLCGVKTYTGTTTIEDGTLRLSPAILESPDIAYWLDASRADTLTCDAEGNVTAWVSANGNGVSFGKNGTQLLPKYSADFLNDMPSVVFTATGVGNGTYNNLIGNKSVTQRTVFIVTKTTKTTGGDLGNFPGIFGANGYDYGQRIQDGATHWRTACTGYTYISPANNLAVNGAMGNGTFTMNVPYVLTMIHADDTVQKTGPIFTPNLGGYSTNGRYNGGISEVIAFNRVLSESERKTVENYLAAKWGVNAQLHANVVPVQTLPATANVVLRAPGVLDLNGSDQTIATLTGEGTITNSSPNAATLTVTGTCSFSGKIAGNVTLVRSGSGTTALDLRGAGGVVFNGGTTSLAAYDYTPPQNGLLYWLDASVPSTIHTNSAGTVTNWSSRVPNMPAGAFVLNVGPVTYDEAASGFGGLPAVRFAQDSGLVAQNSTDTWTLFFVACYDGTSQKQYSGLFGWYNSDYGFRVTNTSGTTVNIGTGSAWTRVGDYLRVNKVQHTSLTTSNLTVPNTRPYVLSCRLAGWQKTVSSRVCRNALNRYIGNGGAKEWIAEVIAYDRALSDEEICDVESYLYDKWIAGAGVARNESVCNGTGGVELQGGAVVNASAPLALNALSAGTGGGTVNGDVSLDGPLVVEVDANGDVQTVRINGNLTIGSAATVIVNDYTKTDKRERYTVVSVSGDVTGAFASTNVDKPWHLYRVGGTWYLLGVGGTTLIFR